MEQRSLTKTGQRLLVMAIFGTAAAFAGAGGRIELLFYDRAGKPMPIEEVRRTSNNGALGYDNDCLLDPKTLKAIGGPRPIKSKDGAVWLDLPDGKPVALAMIWPTKDLGYSLLLLDNSGKGFTCSQSVNFTFQAANDAMAKLSRALAERGGSDYSDPFWAAYLGAKDLLAQAKRSSAEAEKGRLGQLALDAEAKAFNLLLEEHALVRLRRFEPWLGVTFDTTEGYKENVDRTAKMLNPYGWIRIVFDANTTPADYKQLVDEAHSKGLKILGQPVDSSYDKKYTVDQYLAFFKLFVEAFPQIDAWEVGNEVNGEWLTPQIGEKVDKAAAYCKRLRKKTVLTLFWQLNTVDADHSLFNWIDSQIDAKTKANLDVVTLSMYCEQGPMGLFFDTMMRRLHQVFPEQKLAIGELGYWIEGQRFWWAFDRTDPMGRAMRELCNHYYLASLDYPYSVGGVFWWNYLIEFKADPKLGAQVAAIRDRLKLR